jgi:hypothetical protein
VKLTPKVRCYANISAWARHVGIELSNAVEMRADRCFFAPSFNMAESVKYVVSRGDLKPANYRNHGETAVAGWREARGRCAAQIVLQLDHLLGSKTAALAGFAILAVIAGTILLRAGAGHQRR